MAAASAVLLPLMEAMGTVGGTDMVDTASRGGGGWHVTGDDQGEDEGKAGPPVRQVLERLLSWAFTLAGAPHVPQRSAGLLQLLSCFVRVSFKGPAWASTNKERYCAAAIVRNERHRVAPFHSTPGLLPCHGLRVR